MSLLDPAQLLTWTWAGWGSGAGRSAVRWPRWLCCAAPMSSTLRWPAAIRNVLFGRLADPVVLFVHPWEFVDFRRSSLRLH